MPSNSEESSNVIYQIAVRFGDPVLQDGFTSVPNLVLNHYAQLGISAPEMMFTIHVWQYWWTEKDPYPSLNAVAQKMNVTRRQVRNYVQGLKTKGFLRVYERQATGLGQITSEYDFEPLIAAIVALSSDGGTTPRKNLSQGGRKNLSQAPRKQISPEEYKEEKYSVEEDSVSSKDISSLLQSEIASRISKINVANQQSKPSEREDPDLASRPRAGGGTGGLKPVSQLLSLHQAQRLAQIGPDSTPSSSGVRHRRRSSAHKATPWIEQLLTDFSSELHDEEHTKQNISQAARLWKESGKAESSFVQLLYEARSITKQYRVTKRAKGPGGEVGLRNKMPYYFSVLKDLLGMKESGAEAAFGPAAPPG